MCVIYNSRVDGWPIWGNLGDSFVLTRAGYRSWWDGVVSEDYDISSLGCWHRPDLLSFLPLLRTHPRELFRTGCLLRSGSPYLYLEVWWLPPSRRLPAGHSSGVCARNGVRSLVWHRLGLGVNFVILSYPASPETIFILRCFGRYHRTTSYGHIVYTQTLASSPTATFGGNWPKGIINPRPTPQQNKSGSPSLFFKCSTTPLPPGFELMMVPAFKLADQSPKPLDHRNWPIILFLLDLLTASSENGQFGRLIWYFTSGKKGHWYLIIVLSHDIHGAGGEAVQV